MDVCVAFRFCLLTQSSPDQLMNLVFVIWQAVLHWGVQVVKQSSPVYPTIYCGLPYLFVFVLIIFHFGFKIVMKVLIYYCAFFLGVHGIIIIAVVYFDSLCY